MNKLSYSLGVILAQNLKHQKIEGFDSADLAKGIEDVMNEKDLSIPLEEANQFVQQHLQAAAMAQHEEVVAAGASFLAENEKRSEVTTLPSGLQYEVLTEGNGPKPKATDEVTTHYHGTLIDGTIFDSSVQRGQPTSFPVNRVIPGWTEALQLMPVGSKWRLVIPHNLAYGEQGAGDVIKPFSTLVFDVELIGIK